MRPHWGLFICTGPNSYSKVHEWWLGPKWVSGSHFCQPKKQNLAGNSNEDNMKPADNPICSNVSVHLYPWWDPHGWALSTSMFKRFILKGLVCIDLSAKCSKKATLKKMIILCLWKISQVLFIYVEIWWCCEVQKETQIVSDSLRTVFSVGKIHFGEI